MSDENNNQQPIVSIDPQDITTPAANEKFVANAEPEVIEEKRTDLETRKYELQEQVSKLEFLQK